MDEIVIYEKSTCTKCRAAITILDENGVAYRTVRYHDTPLTREKLTDLIRKLGIRAIELFRTKDPVYKELRLGERIMGDDEAVELLLTYPDLIQRPILERGEKAIIGRPSERITEFLRA